jgi:beta-RFAP synthase
LHFGFLDLNGSLGRRFGSFGVALERPTIDLRIFPSQSLEIEGPEPDRLRRYVEAAAVHLGVPALGRVELRSTIPSHAGFGSGTQLALATAAALARMYDKRFDPVLAATALDRGNRSGIGLAAFQDGGLILDGGRDGGDEAPPIIARVPFPEAWRILLILDDTVLGVHGTTEASAFAQLPRFPAADAAHLCRLALMQIFPAAVTGDVDAFGRGVTEVQRCVGDYFAPVQGGRFASPAVAAILAELQAHGAAGVGQSSWGPTGFAIAGSEAEARRLVRVVAVRAHASGLSLVIARGRNRGARIMARPKIERETTSGETVE